MAKSLFAWSPSECGSAESWSGGAGADADSWSGGAGADAESWSGGAGVQRIVLLGDHVRKRVQHYAHKFNIPVKVKNDWIDADLLGGGGGTVFVIAHFHGETFEKLQQIKATVLGPPALIQMATSDVTPTLLRSPRPVYSLAMRGLGICFDGYRQTDKELLKKLYFIIHSMGGRIWNAEALNSKVTHLVARHCKGEKYIYATTFDIPVMQDGWISNAWERRDEAGFVANEEKFQTMWKVKPFHGANIYFMGFSESETAHMIGELLRNGGTHCKDYLSDHCCTHVVVNNHSVTTMPSDVSRGVFVVKEEWFWASIQMDACAEEAMHKFEDYIQDFLSPRTGNTSYFSPSTPGSHGRRKKRRTEAMRQLAQEPGTNNLLSVPSTNKKARSSTSDLPFRGATSGSFIQETPEKNLKVDSLPALPDGGGHKSPLSPKVEMVKKSARFQVFAELVQTEENYVNILKTIVNVFKEPLEDPKSELLNQTQMKIIFGNLPPILNVHSKMLDDFSSMLADWQESHCIGKVILKYASELLKVYPPFVNFFEDTKKTLEECDKANPRFHAFLKMCQSKRECGRQTLTELLIRPVQRLASVSLLLNDLLKYTRKEKDHPDTMALEEALGRLKMVLTNINEDKRKTEGQMHIFEIFSDIENCPPHLVSSHRNFLCKADVVELGGSDELCGKGTELSLFLFSDVLEISKKRRHGNVGGNVGKALGTRSPSTISLKAASSFTATNLPGAGVSTLGAAAGGNTGTSNYTSRPHKHVDMMSLTSIKRVVNLTDGEDCHDCFTLVCRTNQELKERMFVFQLVLPDPQNCLSSGPSRTKSEFLWMLCRNIANTMYRQEPDAYLVHMRPEDLGLAPSDFNITKTYRSLSRVKKAFSFNRTPTTSRLTRAVSSMISPLTSSTTRDHLAAGMGVSTPTGDLKKLRLLSCSNLQTGSSDESPRSTRTKMMPPPPPSPRFSTSSTSSAESPAKEPKNGGFSIPRTPTLRRSSFKFLTNSKGKKFNN